MRLRSLLPTALLRRNKAQRTQQNRSESAQSFDSGAQASSSNDDTFSSHSSDEHAPHPKEAPARPTELFSPQFFERVRYQQYKPHATTRLAETLNDTKSLLFVGAEILPRNLGRRSVAGVTFNDVLRTAALPITAPSALVAAPLIALVELIAPRSPEQFMPSKIATDALYKIGLIATPERSKAIVEALIGAEVLTDDGHINRTILPQEWRKVTTTSPRLVALDLSTAELGGVYAYLLAAFRVPALPAEYLEDLPQTARPYFFTIRGAATAQNSVFAMEALREAGVLDEQYLPKDMGKVDARLFATLQQTNTFIFNLDFRLTNLELNAARAAGASLEPHEALVRTLNAKDAPVYSTSAQSGERTLEYGAGGEVPSYVATPPAADEPPSRE